jgi:MFS family permease
MNTAGIVFGYCIAQFNNFFPYFMQAMYPTIKASEYDFIKALLNTVCNGGGFICTLTSTPLINHFGRRTLFLGSGSLMILISALQPFVPISLFFVLRFIVGYVICFYSILCTMTIKEAIPEKYTGLINSTFYLFIAVGVQLAFFLKYDWVQTYYYLVLMFPIFIEGIRIGLYLIFINVETPRFVYLDIKKTHSNETKKRESESGGDASGDKEQQLLDDSKSQESLDSKFTQDKRTQKYLKVFYTKDRHTETVSVLNEEYKLQNQESKKPKSALKLALSKTYIKQAFIGLLLNLTNQLCGINVIIFYSSNLFEELKFSDPQGLSVIVGLFNVIGGLANLFVTDRFGRKKILSTGIFMITLAYVLQMTGNVFNIKILIPMAMCLFMMSFAMSLGGMLYVYQVEILPGEIIPLVSNFQWVFTLLISYFTLDLIQGLGIYTLYILFFGCSFLTWFVFEGMACETKGKSLSRITSNFLKKKFWQD